MNKIKINLRLMRDVPTPIPTTLFTSLPEKIVNNFFLKYVIKIAYTKLLVEFVGRRHNKIHKYI